MILDEKRNYFECIFQVFIDPLNSFLDGSDPLSSQVKEQDSLHHVPKKNIPEDIDSRYVIWNEYKSNVLSKFKTKQKLIFTSSLFSFIEPGMLTLKIVDILTFKFIFPGSCSSKLLSDTQDISKCNYLTWKIILHHWFNFVLAQTSSDRVKHRLEQLDSLDDGKDSGTKDLSQEQFCNHMNSLKEEMEKAWHSEQKVKALKIAIQVRKID